MDELNRIKNMSEEEQQAYLEELQKCEHDCSSCSAECSSRVKKAAKLVVVVTGGKGGCGKSVMSVLLAKEMKKQGLKVSILDADISGQSVPALLGMHEPVLGDMPEMRPVDSKTGIGVVSLGIIREDPMDPVIYPGIDLAKLAVWMYQETKWPSDLDVLLIDMPSGTGDIPLELYTTMPLDVSLAVITPGEDSSGPARRAVNLADMLRVPCLGIIENFACNELNIPESCSTLPLLATLNYDSRLRVLASQGRLEDYDTDALAFFVRALIETRINNAE